MDAWERIDRAIISAIYRTGLWAIGTCFEPLATSKHRVTPAQDCDVTPASLAALELFLRRYTAGIRTWALFGLALLFAYVAIMLLGSLTIAGDVVLGVWIVWVVVYILRWRGKPEYILGDRVAVALKQGSLGSEARDMIGSLPEDSFLRVALVSLLERPRSRPGLRI